MHRYPSVKRTILPVSQIEVDDELDDLATGQTRRGLLVGSYNWIESEESPTVMPVQPKSKVTWMRTPFGSDASVRFVHPVFSSDTADTIIYRPQRSKHAPGRPQLPKEQRSEQRSRSLPRATESAPKSHWDIQPQHFIETQFLNQRIGYPTQRVRSREPSSFRGWRRWLSWWC